MKVRIQRVHPDAQVPPYGTDGAACFDLVSVGEGCIGLGATAMVYRTGLKFEIPPGHAMFIFSRSGHGFKNDVRLSNCVGVIDSDYRGEVMVKLKADTSTHFPVMKGDRIAQACILPVPKVEFEVAEDLSVTERGEGGFGSTGRSFIGMNQEKENG